MFDFINIEVTSLVPSDWLDNPILRASGFPLEVLENTGEILQRKRIAEYNGLTFKLIPSTAKENGFLMLVTGSIHRYQNDGKHNYNRFTLNQFINRVYELFSKFSINPKDSVLHGLEFGFNVLLPYSPKEVIRSVVVHRSAPYEAISKNRKIGVVCVRNRYEIKIYDKGFASGLFDKNILRIEYKVFKMQELASFSISVLYDLLKYAKVKPLVSLLIDALKDTVFVPPDTDISQLTAREQSNFHEMGKTSTWKDCTPKQRFDKRKALNRILEKCNGFDYQKDLINRLILEANKVLGLSETAEKKVTFAPNLDDIEANEKVTFAPLEYHVQTLLSLSENEKKEKNVFLSPIRVCVSCGKDISSNRAKSWFCSEKYNKDAKKCRNKNSNQRRTIKAKIMKAVVNDQYLRVTYKNLESGNGETFTDILHSSEISVQRGLLNTIVAVEVLPKDLDFNLYRDVSPEIPQMLTGNEAVELLQNLTDSNLEDTNN